MKEQKINEELEKSYAEAEEVLKDTDKVERLLQKLEKKLKAVPLAGSALAYVPVFISILRMYIKKEYTEIPVASVLAIVAVLIYLLNPMDIIPDIIPVVGYVDDAAVVTGAMVLIKTDLDDFLRWRKEKGMEFTDIPDYESIMNKDTKGLSSVIRTFFFGKKKRK